jgi:hypothetical protein
LVVRNEKRDSNKMEESILPITEIIRLVSIVHRFGYSFISSEDFSLELSSQDVFVVLHPELFNLLELVCVCFPPVY